MNDTGDETSDEIDPLPCHTMQSKEGESYQNDALFGSMMKLFICDGKLISATDAMNDYDRHHHYQQEEQQEKCVSSLQKVHDCLQFIDGDYIKDLLLDLI